MNAQNRALSCNAAARNGGGTPPAVPLVSILIPLYNEAEFIQAILQRVLAAPLPAGLAREIIVVDDASTDESAALVEEVIGQNPGVVRLIRSPRNQGKGAAIRQAVKFATGDYCLIQDADLEYSPEEYPKLLEPLIDGSADVVFGSRFLSSGRRRVLYYWHSVANHLLTTFCNIISNLNLTDMETCYKAFRTPLLKSTPIRSNRFGFEPEITIKMAKRQARIYEVPISYRGRTYEEGKKIGLKDAIQAVFVMLRFWIVDDLYQDLSAEILDAFSVAPRFNQWMADAIRPYVRKSVLEIGAGMGNLTRQLARGRKRYIATDIDEEHLSRLKTRLSHWVNLETCLCDVSRASDFESLADSVDTVVCFNVLEHIEDDLAALRNLRSALAPGGRAIVLVPCGEEIFGQLDVILGHHRRYSVAQLRAVFERAGFVVEKVLEFNRISRPGWYITGKLLKRSRISRTQLKLFDKLVWLWRRVDPFVPWPATSLIAIAAKPPVSGTGEQIHEKDSATAVSRPQR
ncbi:MAG: glycosyl transferase [Terriglobia bacterium]|nr:MAG: glycosyl transferase [Terriglobia bacterium]